MTIICNGPFFKALTESDIGHFPFHTVCHLAKLLTRTNMETALFYYKYSDRNPAEWNLAIDVRVPFNVDIGVGDVIVPCAEERSINTQLPDFEAPVIKTYSLESTIAEKFEGCGTFQGPLQQSEMERCKETCEKVGFYTVLTAQVDRPCLKLCFHGPESVLNLSII